MTGYLSKAVKLTVCADGFVSVLHEGSRRLGAGLPFYSVDFWPQAEVLIKQLCDLRPCAHGGKLGITIEPKAPHWPLNATVEDIRALGDLFHAMDPARVEDKP